MKNFFLSFLCVVTSFGGWAQTQKYDSVAILIFDRMSDVIGDLQSCSFTLNTSSDIKDVDHGMIKHFSKEEVYMSGPNRMLVNSEGRKGHRQYWYNGKELAYYSYSENNYARVKTPHNIMAMIDSINTNYGIEFPAADFFYPAFTDDMIQNSDDIKYLGQTIINGVNCFHILSTSKEVDVQVWVSSDAFNLPVKFVITYNFMDGHPQYEATFSNWQVNPEFPIAMFEFTPPPGAAKIRMIAKNQK